MLWLLHKGAAMTNKDLLNKAMPLTSLSNAEWDLITVYAAGIKDKTVADVINKLCTNQARLEIKRNYLDYYFDKIDDQVDRQSLPLE